MSHVVQDIVHHVLVGGIPTPLKKYEFVNWDDETPNIWKNKSHVPVTTNQYMYEPQPNPVPRKLPSVRTEGEGKFGDLRSTNALSSPWGPMEKAQENDVRSWWDLYTCM